MMGGGYSRFYWIPPLIHVPTDIELIHAAGGFHELPWSRGPCAREGSRVEAGFDEGQIHEFGRKPKFPKDGLDDLFVVVESV